MSNQEIELSDVMIVLHIGPGHDLPSQIQELNVAGLKVVHIDAENAVVEGTIESRKLPALSKLPCVKYLRDIFNYMTETADVKRET